MKALRKLSLIFLLCLRTVHGATADTNAANDRSTLPSNAQSSMSAALGNQLSGLNLYPGSLMQLAQLTASDGVQSDNLGWSVAMSGNTVVLTGLGTSAYVFVKPQTGWANMTQTAELTTSNGAVLGRCIAMSGNVIAVGAEGATVGQNSLQGAVYIYVKPESGWTNMTETAELTASDGLKDSSLAPRSLLAATQW